MPRCRVRGVDLFYEERGQGPTLVLLHGLGNSSRDWEQQFPALEPNYRVIAPDFRGFGRSERPAGPYSVAEFAADISALLNALRVEQAHLLGFSMGGAVAFQLAVDEPWRWLTLTIVNSQPSFRAQGLRRKLEYWVRHVVVRVWGLDQLAAAVVRRLFPDPHQAELRAKMQGRYADNDADVYLKVISALVQWDVRDRLAEIGCPVLILAAEHDYFPLSDTRAYLPLLADARLQVVADARHGLPIGRPEQFNQLVLEFLDAARA